MRIQRILTPTDLSDKSTAALSSAATLINSTGKKIDFLHVIPLSRYLGDSFDRLGIPLNMEKDVFPKIIENKRREMQEFANDFVTRKENLGEVFITVDRRPSDSIVKQAEKGNYDLIMMSAKGEHESDFMHGSATEKVIRHSKIPVLILTENVSLDSIKTIVVPCDFSKRSLSAIPIAFDVARMFNANIEILNIVELYSADIHGLEPTVLADLNEDDVYDGLMNQIKQFFNSYSGASYSLIENGDSSSGTIIREHEGVKENVKFKCVVTKSVAAHHEIVEYANEHADLLVMSTHGRSGLSRMLLGSTTEQVIQHLDKPQITIKTTEKD